MTDDERLEQDLRRWFHSLDLQHPAVRELWRLAIAQKRKAKETAANAS